jgi:predicted transcriptional regulator
MVFTREKVLQGMAELPNEFSLDDLMERLILLQKIEIGFQQIKEGKVISHEEIKKRVRAWQK